MERNNESRNRYNDRNTNQSDNDWNQPSDFQQYRNQNADRDENQWDGNRRNEGRDQYNNRDQQTNYGRNRFRNNANSGRLDSMGPLGNDTDRFDDDDFRRRGTYGQTGNRRDNFDDRDRNRGASYNNRGNDRNWWDKTKDEVSGWFGDENAQQRRNVDQQNEHRGKGPKGYTRADERIKEDVHERLTDDGQVDASEIEVDVRNGEIFLKGTVKDRQQKRRAEYIVEDISGVTNVENHIKVQQDNSTPGNSGQNYGQQYGEKKFGTNAGSGINVGTEFNTHN